MEQLVALILFALVSFISWSIQKSQEKRQERARQRRTDQGEDEPEPIRRTSGQPVSESEEAMRRLREALGLPDDEEFEPAPPRRAEPPPIVVVEEERPVVFERPVFEQRPVVAPPPVVRERRPPPLPVPERSVVSTEAEGPRRKFTPARKVVAEVETVRPALDVRALLNSPGGARDAVVLSEVLGRPKSLAS